ncbi:hypothetical protein BG000_000992 [Podila horticola]|nr:hypothetical protein BG000_000992 [Podila horticola]
MTPGGNTGSAGSGSYSGPSSVSSFLEFAGNSRYQAFNLARFSTFSAASASSSSSSPNSNSENPSCSPLSSTPSTPSQQDQTGSDKSSQPHSNSVEPETQSPQSSTTATSGSQEDKDDDWAVNESFSGHSGHGFAKAPSSDSGATSESNNADTNNPTHTTPPSPSSFKDSASIQASWRRTSDSIPAVATPGGPSLSSQSKAGGLDLSSSTLVQQMLFKERPPHADKTESDKGWKEEDEDKNSKAVDALPAPSDSHSTPSLISLMENQTSSQGKKPKTDTKEKSSSSGDEDDHISKLDIRVGVVRSVANHPDAESLYIELVDVGDMDGELKKEPRTIVSGLVHHVPKEYLEGRAVIVVGNMKPSKLRGVMSEGMLLCAMEQDADGQVTKVALLEPAEGSQPGDKVIFEGYTDQDTVPAPVLTPKRKWFEKARIHFSVQDGVAYYKGSPFKTVLGLVRCKSIATGQIS